MKNWDMANKIKKSNNNLFNIIFLKFNKNLEERMAIAGNIGVINLIDITDSGEKVNIKNGVKIQIAKI